MPILHLETKTKEQELVKSYLEQNASDILADKINNGVRIDKDGKQLISRKTLDGFMAYACNEARKTAEKGKNAACVEESVVYGWAVHYFEEDSVEGTLYNEDGTEYKPVVKKATTVASPVPPPKPEPKPQMSMFDLLTPQTVTPALEPVDGTPFDEEPTEEEIFEALQDDAEDPDTEAVTDSVKHWINDTTYVDDDGVMHEVKPTASDFDRETVDTLQRIVGEQITMR